MPTKFKPNEKSYDRRTNVTKVIRHYIKAMSKKELFDYLNSSNAKPKRKHKVIKELERRGIKIKWLSQD